MNYRIAAKCTASAVLILALVWGTVTAGLREDINGDGRVGVLDVIALLMLGRADPTDRRADYDGDGVFSVADAVALLGNIGRVGTGPGGGHRPLPEGAVPVDSAGSYAEPGVTYMLTRNISSPVSAIFLGKDVTLDLNGYTITYADAGYGHVPNSGFERGLDGWDVSAAPGAEVRDTRTTHTFVGEKLLLLPYGQEIVSDWVHLPVANRSYYAMCGVAKLEMSVSVFVEDSTGSPVYCDFRWGDPATVRVTCPEEKRSPKLGGGFVFAWLRGLPEGRYRIRVRAESNNVLIDEIDIRPALDVGVGIVDRVHPWAYYKSILDGDYTAFADYLIPDSTSSPVSSVPRVRGAGTVTIRNGVIRSGAVGVRSWGVQSTAADVSVVLENVRFEASGINTFAVDVPQATIRDCRFEMDSPFIIDRHRQGDQPVNLRGPRASEVSGCTFIGGQGCMTVAGDNSLVHDNLFVNRQMVTNHYSLGLGDSRGTKVFNNRFEPEIGSGILIGRATDCEIYDNLFRIASSPPTCEYGFEDYSVNAIRITDYNAAPGQGSSGIRIHNNDFHIIGRDYPERASYIPMAYAVFMSVGGGRNYIQDNNIVVEHLDPESKALAAAFYVGASNNGGEWRGNTITSNVPGVWVGTPYGSAMNALFRNNTFRLAAGADTAMKPVKLGHGGATARNVEFRSNVCEGMAFSLDLTSAVHSWKVYWTLEVVTVNAAGERVGGREVVITDATGAQALRSTTDADGVLRTELLEYSAEGASRSGLSPYTVTAGAGSVSVVLDSNRSVQVRAE